MRNKRRTLAYKAIPLMIRIAVSIIIFTTLGVAIITYIGRRKDYRDLAMSYARVASEYIDGDRINEYLETGEKDDYYDQILDYLTMVGSNSGIKYYYVYVPGENDIEYVWDAPIGEDVCDLGVNEQYMKNGKEYSFKNFSKNPTDDILVRRDRTYGFIAVAAYPIFDSTGEPVALAGVDMDMNGLLYFLFKYVFIIAVCVVVVLFFAMLAWFRSVKYGVLDPLLKVNSAARQMIDSLDKDEIVTIDVHTGDELEELAETFDQMYREMRRYLKNLVSVTSEKERIGTELNVATKIQVDMLPCIFPAFPHRDDFDIFASMTPAKEVGGDFYDFFLLDDDHLCMVMADVSGKGVPAALFMVISKTLIKDQAQMCQSPKTILEEVNNKLLESNGEGMFVTVWLGIMQISTGKIVAANAGHEKPAIKKVDGMFELVNDKHGMMLGAMPGISFTEYEMELEKGGCLFLYTDGVPEATDPDNVLFGTDRMIEALNKDPGATPEMLLDNIKKATDDFTGDAPQFDDLTMLAVTRK